MNRTLSIGLPILIVLVLTGLFLWMAHPKRVQDTKTATTTPAQVLSFADCAAAGYPVMESMPRQCRTPDGRSYAEEIPEHATYTNASADMITVTTPAPGAVTGKTVSITGKARGTWYFEASFPIQLIAADGTVLASGVAQAQGDWMTEDFVPFKASLTAPTSYIGRASLVLKRDNPSGLPERDGSVSVPLTIEY